MSAAFIAIRAARQQVLRHGTPLHPGGGGPPEFLPIPARKRMKPLPFFHAKTLLFAFLTDVFRDDPCVLEQPLLMLEHQRHLLNKIGVLIDRVIIECSLGVALSPEFPS